LSLSGVASAKKPRMAFEKIGPFGIGERGKPEAVDDE
jgi:hypothetical protein